jgi:hypothetical protein
MKNSQRKRTGDCVAFAYHAHPGFTPVYEEIRGFTHESPDGHETVFLR